WCSVVTGDFTHVGTTPLFRELMPAETEFSRHYGVQQRLGVIRQAGVRSAGGVGGRVLSAGVLVGGGAVVIWCRLDAFVRASYVAVLQGLDGIAGALDVPQDAVVHQIPVVLADGRRGTVIRTYGVHDDPKALVSRGGATWFGRALPEQLRSLGLDEIDVWP